MSKQKNVDFYLIHLTSDKNIYTDDKKAISDLMRKRPLFKESNTYLIGSTFERDNFGVYQEQAGHLLLKGDCVEFVRVFSTSLRG